MYKPQPEILQKLFVNFKANGMDFGYKTITPKKGFKLQISLLSDFPGYVLALWYSRFHLWGENNRTDDVYLYKRAVE